MFLSNTYSWSELFRAFPMIKPGGKPNSTDILGNNFNSQKLLNCFGGLHPREVYHRQSCSQKSQQVALGHPICGFSSRNARNCFKISLSLLDLTFCLSSTTDCCPLLLIVAHWCPLLPIVVHWCPLLPIVVHCCPLLSIVVHCCPLLPIVVHLRQDLPRSTLPKTVTYCHWLA